MWPNHPILRVFTIATWHVKRCCCSPLTIPCSQAFRAHLVFSRQEHRHTASNDMPTMMLRRCSCNAPRPTHPKRCSSTLPELGLVMIFVEMNGARCLAYNFFWCRLSRRCIIVFLRQQPRRLLQPWCGTSANEGHTGGKYEECLHHSVRRLHIAKTSVRTR
jgi:hypothetical protein